VTPTPNRLRTIFDEALEIGDPQQRKDFVFRSCGTDEALRQEVEDLLRVEGVNSQFLPEEPQGMPLSPAGLSIGRSSQCAGNGSLSREVGNRIGRYKVLQKLGEGGCGVVYLAEQKEPVQRKVALKVIKLGMDTRSVVARFKAEEQALARMDHPNIARVFDGGATEAGRPYFVMELVRGMKITEYCDQYELSTRERLELFVQVCQAVQHAHQKGIIHRDLKPSNILVTENGGSATPKVIDFGIAKATQGSLTDQTLFTAFEQFLGTPAYMSPEQSTITTAGIDTRSDIYSLGVLLYELLTGTTPFDTKKLMAAGLDEMRRTISEKEPERPSTRLSTMGKENLALRAQYRKLEPPRLIHLVRGDLDWIVMKCLEKAPNQRYETVNGLAMDIKRYLSNEPVLARPPSHIYRFQKLVKRHRLGFTAVGGITAALIVGFGVSTWMYYQEREARAAVHRLLYVADMNLAQQAWEQNNMRSLRQWLEDTQTSSERGFEWYYWQRQCHLAWRTFRGHTNPVTSVAFSPDGKWIVTCSADTTARVWDVASGRELLKFEQHTNKVTSVAISPDGRHIVTGSTDQTARVWDATTGLQLAILKGHTNEVMAVAFSPDGLRIATGSADNTARVWNAVSGNELLSFKEHSAAVCSVSFSSVDQRIVTSSRDNRAIVWDATTGRSLFRLKAEDGWFRSVAFSPDGQRILTGGSDKRVMVWEPFRDRTWFLPPVHSDQISSVAFSRDGQRIVTCSRDRTAKIWEMSSHEELLTLKGHTAWVRSAAFSPDGQSIVTASDDNTAMLWKVDPSRELLTLKGHTNGIGSVAFSPDGERVLTGSDDQQAKLWDVTTCRELRSFTNHITLKGELTLSVAFSPTGSRIVTGGEDQTGRVWEVDNGRELFTLQGHKFWIGSVAFSPDGSRIVTGSGDNTAKVWNAIDGGLLLTLKEHERRIWSVAYSPDGLRIVTGSGDGTAKVWNAKSGERLFTIRGHTDWVRSVAFSPDSRRIVTGSADKTARVWDATTGVELVPSQLKGHAAAVRSVAFSPDGRRIVTGSEDQTAKVWDAARGRELLTLKGHNSRVRSVAFSPDGLRIITGSQDQTAKVWTAARPEEVEAWQQEEQ